jgi:hypothetical protein
MHYNPINPQAIAEGRSTAPPLPECFDWILLTRQINEFLHSAYTIEQVKQMPSDELYQVQLLVRYAR